MNISTLAKSTGLPVSKIRFLEKRGLVESFRLPNGYREYDTTAVEQIRVILSAQNLGFTLAEIRDTLGASAKHVSKKQIKDQLLRKLNEIDLRLVETMQLRQKLSTAISDVQICISRGLPERSGEVQT
jgi:MerR family transcriptional regulator, copper efflux regulator